MTSLEEHVNIYI